MLLHWLEIYEHCPIALVGGGTILVGDPSGKDSTRRIMSLAEINKNIKKIEKHLLNLLASTNLSQ